MKRLLIMSALLTAIAMSLPFVMSAKNDAGDKTAPILCLEPDKDRLVTVLSGNEVLEMSVYDYLVGVVAAEMPVYFEAEALKAQAVAARSYLQRAISDGARHENAQVCTDYECCQAYMSLTELQERWGYDYEAYISRIESAVKATDAQYLCYDGKAAFTAFHSSSAGMTEDSGELWDELPYLVSVSSPESEEDVPNFVSTVSLSELDFRDTVLYAAPEADMTGAASEWVQSIERDESGRVKSAKIGGAELSGVKMRSLFKLRSTAFELEYADGSFVFTVKGYGHGVGMSQYGANVMAKQGSSYEEILAHYYPKTTLVK